MENRRIISYSVRMPPIYRFWAVGLMSLPVSFLPASASDQGTQIVEYGCGDVVAVGRFETLSYTDLSTADDLLGHGRFMMRVTIKQILRGRENRRTVSASHIAHAQLVSDRDFLIVLSPDKHEDYTLKEARLLRYHTRPVIAQKCRNGSEAG